MYKKSVVLLMAPALFALASCKPHYELTAVSYSRILINNKYDAHPNHDAQAFLAPYKHQVDSIMSPVVGEVTEYMAARKPESKLSNLLAAIMRRWILPFITWAEYVQPLPKVRLLMVML